MVRGVGWVFAKPEDEVDRIERMIHFAVDMTQEKALKQSKDLSELVKNDERVKKLLEISRTLEGLARHCSTHAAGVVIAPTALTDYVPLFKGSRDEITTQFDMKMVEEVGLLKMDFLGLRTLSVIDDALRLISENYPALRWILTISVWTMPKFTKCSPRGIRLAFSNLNLPVCAITCAD